MPTDQLQADQLASFDVTAPTSGSVEFVERGPGPMAGVATETSVEGGTPSYQSEFQSSGSSQPVGPSTGRDTRTASASIHVGWSKPDCRQ